MPLYRSHINSILSATGSSEPTAAPRCICILVTLEVHSHPVFTAMQKAQQSLTRELPTYSPGPCLEKHSPQYQSLNPYWDNTPYSTGGTCTEGE